MEHLGFSQIFVNEYAAGYMNEEKGIIACVAAADYIPINKFKELFEMMSEEVKAGSYQKFVFDKSALRTFHQPSMKWYFTEWKTEMLPLGLTKHYKVLPKLDYFRKSVEAARKPLLAKYPKDILDKIRIDYFETLEEAVNAA